MLRSSAGARPALCEIEQLVSGENASGARDEGEQQVELAAGDVDDRAVWRAQDALSGFQSPSVELVCEWQIVRAQRDLAPRAAAPP